MNSKAFTLIELIVVISIITILTASSALYFSSQISTLELNSSIDKTLSIVDTLDYKVDTKIITDYSLYLDARDTYNLYSKYSVNNIGIDYRQELLLDGKTGTGFFSTAYTNTGSTYIFKIYEGVKFREENLIDASDSFETQLDSSNEYRIEASLSGTILNTVGIEYINDRESGDIGGEIIILSGICENNDKTSCYTSLEIQRYGNNKIITATDSGGTEHDLDIVYLFFEKQGIEVWREIRK